MKFNINNNVRVKLTDFGRKIHRENGKHATLKIVKIPDGVEWEIEEYDGREWISEKHRTWN